MNVLKRFARWILTEKRRSAIALRLLGDRFYLVKKSVSSNERLTLDQLKAMTPAQRPVQNVLSMLPHVMPGYLTTDWFWADTYYPYYVKLASLLQPRSILEIGSLQGFSLISMAEGCTNLESAYWIDNELYLPNSNQMCYENFGFYYKTFRPGSKIPQTKFMKNSWDAMRLQKKVAVDLIHIDGEHSYDGKLRDLSVCSALHPRYIVLDDYFNTINHEAIDYWAACNQYDFFVIDTFNRGLAVFDFSRKKNSMDLAKKNGLPIAKVFRWKSPDRS
ncbi:MAG TPA: class I SAM-dependent methyltransferase [Bacteroidota bacterium]|nr:class I SAM-dependent methyltransferase [Bacteroidota bacterium]